MILGFFLSINNLHKIETNYKLLEKITLNYSIKNTIIGKIEDKQNMTKLGQNYILEIKKIDNKEIKNTIKLLVIIPSNLIYKKGDIVEFETNIIKIKPINNFEYDKYLLKSDIYGQIFVYNGQIIGREISKLDEYIYKIKNDFLSKLSQIFPGKSQVLLAGILIGDKVMMDTDFKSDFNKSGLSHIVAVSGYNITILIIFLGLFINKMPGFIKIFIIFIVISFFVLLVGIDNSPALRAAIMGILGYIATTSQKKININSALTATILYFVISNPLVINYDISLHLSVFALLGIIIFAEKINKKMTIIPDKFLLRESFATTLSVIFFSFPLIITNFGTFSIISPIANLLVIPFIPIVMLFGFISLTIFYLSPILSIIIGFPAWIMLDYILKIANYLGNWQFSTINISFGNYNYLFFIFYYFIIFALISYFYKIEENYEFIEDNEFI